MATEKKNRMFKWFNANRANRPDALEEDTSPTLKRYFKLLGRRFWQLISVNVMMLPMIIPIVLLFFLSLGFEQTPVQNSYSFPQLYGANLIEQTPATTTVLDLFGAQLMIPVYNVWTYIFGGLCVAFMIATFGWQNVGITYIMRNMVRGDAVFPLSDYFYAIKRNLKQGFFLGLLDLVLLFLIVFDIVYLWNSSNFFAFFGICAIAILYFFMRFYMYLMLVTFDLSIRKILKNSLIFITLGIKRNLMAVLGLVLITVLNLLLFPLLGATPLGIAIPLILPLLYYLAVCTFTTTYAAYPIIERYMITPYLKKEDEEDVEEVESDATDPDEPLEES